MFTTVKLCSLCHYSALVYVMVIFIVIDMEVNMLPATSFNLVLKHDPAVLHFIKKHNVGVKSRCV